MLSINNIIILHAQYTGLKPSRLYWRIYNTLGPKLSRLGWEFSTASNPVMSVNANILRIILSSQWCEETIVCLDCLPPSSFNSFNEAAENLCNNIRYFHDMQSHTLLYILNKEEGWESHPSSLLNYIIHTFSFRPHRLWSDLTTMENYWVKKTLKDIFHIFIQSP